MLSSVRKILKTIPETYILNGSQLFHMLILAAFVPWYIGIESYGVFVAIFALPGIVQSCFETFSVIILSKYHRRDLLNKPVLFILLPILVIFSVVFFVFLGTISAVLAIMMTILLFSRSYAFALAITCGNLTQRIVVSEALVLLAYVVVILCSVLFDIRDHNLPLAMVIMASLLSAWHLLRATMQQHRFSCVLSGAEQTKIPLIFAMRAVAAKAFEDGQLTFPPLFLTALVSPMAAGQFRILASFIKMMYKFYPYRYEIVIRDIERGRLKMQLLKTVSFILSALPIVLALVVYLFFFIDGTGWLLIVVSSTGVSAACIALYPYSCTKTALMPLGLLISIGITLVMTWLFGDLGFAIGFAGTSFSVMMASLFIINQVLRLRKEHENKLA